MKGTGKRLEEIFADIAFAEERSFRASEKRPKKRMHRLEDIFSDIAMAEGGEYQ
ncbi:MAG: hypothetical protein JSU90_05750 [Nitrospiraceae bacterium]|nr:MAG: hypothetical protein JSU90_05750 [Nitrospiraceae bacterium]